MAQIYKIDGNFDKALFAGSSCAFGVFDGVHKGHRYLLDAARDTAAQSGGASIALTFDIDPDEMFAKGKLKKLLSNADRIDRLAASGVDAVCVLSFTPAFAAEEPLEFLKRTFGGHAPAHLHVGSDFAFGARAAGTVADLKSWAATVGCTVHAHHLVSADGMPISATRIRGLLAAGQLDEANKLLGRPYALHETVRKGRQEGRDMGFRTANLVTAPERCVLADGVYAGYAIVDGVRYAAAISNGIAPMFADRTDANCEVHILDFSGDLYGQAIWVEFVHRLRPMIKFDSVDELIKTVMSDIEWTRTHMKVDSKEE